MTPLAGAQADKPAARPSVSAVRVAGDPEGKGWRLGVIGKRTWTVSRGQCELSTAQVPLVEEPIYDEKRAVLLHDADVLLNRRKTDVIVGGHVYPPGGRTPFDFGVQVGDFLRLARAFGPRRVARHAVTGRAQFSSPAIVEKIPLGWESSYGGVDQAARADIGDPFEESLQGAGIEPDPRFGLFAYPRNPVGRGYVIEPTPAGFDACELPLIEDPESLLTPDNLVRNDFVCWPEGPAVAGFGWLSYAFFPRSALLGAPPLVYDGARIPPSGFHEVRRGEIHAAAVRPDRPLAERLGVGVAQAAAIGMRADSVAPGDVVALQGLHPRDLRWSFRVPAESPRMHVRFAGEKPIELPPPLIRTVLIQPDEDRLTLVWTAEIVLPAAPGPTRLQGLEHVVLWKP
jgi:hypothetical protein